MMQFISWILALSMTLSGCVSLPQSSVADTLQLPENQNIQTAQTSESTVPVKTGFITGQILDGVDGEIHYSYYLPEGYDESKHYPLMMVMPGYDMMWFGEESSGSNLQWNGFLSWTKLDEDMIVVSAQLTDWGEKSARQAVELTGHFLENFAADSSKVYAAGYSAGGETMSQAVSMRPDLYAAYLHGASHWDGTYAPIAENGVAVYIYMAENDEYYGFQKARNAFDGLYDAYQKTGLTEEQISELLKLEIPNNEHFNRLGIYNYHSGGNILFDDETTFRCPVVGRYAAGGNADRVRGGEQHGLFGCECRRMVLRCRRLCPRQRTGIQQNIAPWLI